MDYETFCRVVEENNYPRNELRFDVPPSDEIVELMESMGLKRYEKYVLRMQSEGRI